jgi:DNA-directed RNA polymerase beta' subunit
MANEERYVIKSVTFSVLEADDILNMSVREISIPKDSGDGGVYDLWTGTCAKGMKCLTCGGDFQSCVGHFGHICLNQPVIHPFFQEEVVKYMNTFCYFCHKLVLSPDMLCISGKRIFNTVHQKCSKAEQCQRCRKRKPEFFEDDNKIYGHYNDKKQSVLVPVKGILDHFKKLDIQDLAFLRVKNPSRFIITALPVMPPQDRPFVRVSDKEYNDDLTTKYCTIVKINSLLNPLRPVATKSNKSNDQVNRLKISDSLDFHVRTLMTNSRNLAKQKNNKPTKAIGDRLGGKNGIMRGRLMGKRVNQSARTVAGPDPTLDVDEVGIPKEVASELTVQQRVCATNIGYLTELLEEGKINSIIKDGKKIFNMKEIRKGTDPRQLLFVGDRVLRNGKILDPVEIEYAKGWPSNCDVEVYSNVKKKMIKWISTPKFVLKEGDQIIRGGEITFANEKCVVPQDVIVARHRNGEKSRYYTVEPRVLTEEKCCICFEKFGKFGNIGNSVMTFQCGHMCMHVSCFASSMTDCPMCREPIVQIKGVVKDVLPGDMVITGARIVNPVFPKTNLCRLSKDGNCVVSRQLRDGDYILVNRQPTIHEFNIMAHRVKILPGKTIRMNLAICSAYNADFDGMVVAVNSGREKRVIR